MNDVSPYLKRPLRSEADMIACERDHWEEVAADLLTALEEIVAITDRKHNAWDKARAAIAKATQ